MLIVVVQNQIIWGHYYISIPKPSLWVTQQIRKTHEHRIAKSAIATVLEQEHPFHPLFLNVSKKCI